MKALITYDLKSGSPEPNELFLAAAQNEGIISITKGIVKDTIYRLPKSTVWGQFDSAADATSAFSRAINLTSSAVGYEVEVEKRMTVAFSYHGIRSDVSVSVDPEYVGENDYETALLHQKNVSLFKLPRSLFTKLNLASMKS